MNDAKTVLIVERNPEVAGVMTAHFQDLGYQVATAPNAPDAMIKIRLEPPHVVVMGLTTPRLGGVDGLRLIRRWHPDLSVVLTDSERLPRRATAGASPDDGSAEEWRSLDRLVELAAAQSRSSASDTRREEPLRQPPAVVPLEQPRILVVDDLEDMRDLLRDFLEREGYAVEVAGDAASAISKLAKVKPHVIVLDISMPGLSGISALQQLRARDPKVGVIMVTRNEDENLARRTLALGAFDYVRKPIDGNYLRRSIQTLLIMRALVPADSLSEPETLTLAV